MGQKGFTLIELSIVLVILGLLVGGIVGGKSLIHQAELHKIVADFHTYETAFNAYINQYDALPGDHAEAEEYWPGKATKGNGDGQIWDCTPANGQGMCEDTKAIQHLVLAELIGFHYFDDFEPYVIGENIPPGAIDGMGYRFGGVPWCGGGAGSCNPATAMYNRQGVFLLAASAFSDLYGTSLKPADARNIDAKMDDGIPTSGRLLADELDDGECVEGKTADSGTGDVGNQRYNVANAGITCIMLYALK